MKPILLIVRAPPGECGTCDNYTTNISPSYMSYVKKDGRLQVLELTRESKDSIYVTTNKSQPIHPEIYQWVAWWPCFIIVTAESWKRHSGSLVGSIFGGAIDPSKGVPLEIAGEYNLKNEESLILWTDKVLSQMAHSGTRSGRRRITYQEHKENNDYLYGWGKESHEY